jgi:hypothetical protein
MQESQLASIALSSHSFKQTLLPDASLSYEGECGTACQCCHCVTFHNTHPTLDDIQTPILAILFRVASPKIIWIYNMTISILQYVHCLLCYLLLLAQLVTSAQLMFVIMSLLLMTHTIVTIMFTTYN